MTCKTLVNGGVWGNLAILLSFMLLSNQNIYKFIIIVGQGKYIIDQLLNYDRDYDKRDQFIKLRIDLKYTLFHK